MRGDVISTRQTLSLVTTALTDSPPTLATTTRSFIPSDPGSSESLITSHACFTAATVTPTLSSPTPSSANMGFPVTPQSRVAASGAVSTETGGATVVSIRRPASSDFLHPAAMAIAASAQMILTR